MTNSLLVQICLLAQVISGATRVAIAQRMLDGRVNVVARNFGQSVIREARYSLPLLSEQRTSILFEDVRKVPEFISHPVFEVVPNLHGIIAFAFRPKGGLLHTLSIYNPLPSTFKSDLALKTLEQLGELVCAVVSDPLNAEQHLQDFPDITDEIATLREPAKLQSAEPTAQFLTETLINKQRLLARNGVSYVAIRQWRKPIKPYQISALAVIKKNCLEEISAQIAKEMHGAVTRLFGTAFEHVVPIPCGSSGLERCLSVQIAENLARILGCNFSNILQSGPTRQGSSHPKKSATLSPYRINSKISGKVLIVDDVATSGRHIELANLALGPMANHCTSLVWIAD